MIRFTAESLRKAIKTVSAGIATLALTAGLAGTAAAQGNTTIKVGTLPIITQLPLFTALDKGYFKEFGLDVEMRTFQGGAGLVEALNVNAVDIAGAVNILTYFQSVSQGFDNVVVAGDSGTGKDPNSGVMMLATRKDSGINSLKDLAGKRIGLPNLRNFNWAYHLEYLSRNGVDTSKISWIEVGIPRAPAALLTGQVDATDLVEPFATVAMQSGEAKKLYNVFAAMAPDGLISVQAARREWANANADALVRFVGALKRADKYNEANQQEARERLSRYTKIDKNLADALDWPVFKLDVESKDLQVPMELGLKYELLKDRIQIDKLIFRSARPQ